MNSVFTDKQVKILELRIQGLRNKEIANKLNVSDVDVSQTINKIREKIKKVDDTLSLFENMGIIENKNTLRLSDKAEIILNRISEEKQQLQNLQMNTNLASKTNRVTSFTEKPKVDPLPINPQKQIYDSSLQLAITTLSRLDSVVGIIPAILAIMEYRKYSEFDIKKFISKMRQYRILQEIFNEPSDSKLKIRNMSNSESLIFSHPIPANKLTKDFVKRIFESLKSSGQILEYLYNPMEKGCYDIVKSSLSQKMFLSQIVYELQNSINISSDWRIKDNFFIENSVSFEKQINLTIDLFNQLQDNFPVNFNNELRVIQSKYRKIINFPLVGNIKGFPNQIGVYMLSYYETNDGYGLDVVDRDISHITIESFSENFKLKNILRECNDLCRLGDRQCYLKQMIIQPKKSNSLCVFSLLTFSKEIIRSKDTGIFHSLREQARKLGWNSWHSRVSWNSIPLT